MVPSTVWLCCMNSISVYLPSRNLVSPRPRRTFIASSNSYRLSSRLPFTKVAMISNEKMIRGVFLLASVVTGIHNVIYRHVVQSHKLVLDVSEADGNTEVSKQESNNNKNIPNNDADKNNTSTLEKEEPMLIMHQYLPRIFMLRMKKQMSKNC